MADSRKLDLIFKDSKKATKNIRIPNPRTDVDKEAVLPVMEKVLESKIFLSRNNLPVETVQAAKVTDVQDLLADPAADHGRPDPAGRPGCSVRLPHGHLLVPIGTDGRETGEPDPEHRTAAHGSEDGIEKKRAAKKNRSTLFCQWSREISDRLLRAYQI